MPKTDAADREEADMLGSPQALRALAAKAKQFAASWPQDVRRRIIESALRLEAEAAMLEQLQQG